MKTPNLTISVDLIKHRTYRRQDITSHPGSARKEPVFHPQSLETAENPKFVVLLFLICLFLFFGARLDSFGRDVSWFLGSRSFEVSSLFSVKTEAG